jgi:putative intracellular protease/amidase
MDELDRFKTYSSMTETSRKWVSVMDAKAGFISALCAASLAFIWTGAKLVNSQGCVKALAITATLLILTSLFLALRVILPRVILSHAFGKDLVYTDDYHPITYFSYVAAKYPTEKHQQFLELVDSMDEKAFAREAIEQHYTISHVLERKSKGVAIAGWVWLISTAVVVVDMILRG